MFPPRHHIYQHYQSVHHVGVGSGGIVSDRRWKMTMMANDDASMQQACTSTNSDTSFTYTRLDDDDDDENNYSQNTNTIASQRDMQHILQVMEKAAYLAGSITRATFGRIAIQMTKANERDLVTQSDLQCQRLIRDVLSKEFPNDLFLGEEEEDDVNADGGGKDSATSTIPSSVVLKNSLNSITLESGGNEDRLLFVVVRVHLILFI